MARQRLSVRWRSWLTRDARRAIGGVAGMVVLLTAAYLLRADDLFHDRDLYRKLLAVAGALLFLAVGVFTVRHLAAVAAERTSRRLTIGHGAALRLVVQLGGYVALVIFTFNALGVNLGQLLVGGAVTGVIIGIAAQQSLGNVFAGLVLVGARPFEIGSRLVVHSGALGGPHEGCVIEMGLVYVTLDTDDGPINLPNSAVLNAAVQPVTSTHETPDPNQPAIPGVLPDSHPPAPGVVGANHHETPAADSVPAAHVAPAPRETPDRTADAVPVAHEVPAERDARHV